MIQLIDAFVKVLLFNLVLYGVFSVGPYLALWRILPDVLAQKRIQQAQLFPTQLAFELKSSLRSMFVVSLALTPLYLSVMTGNTRITPDLTFSGWKLLPFFLISFLVQDIWFYGSHRWLHSKWAFPRVHWVHHKSKVPTPLASHSFHWFEAVLQYAFLYPLCYLLPMTLADLMLFLALMHFFATWGHFNYELMPKRVWTHPLGSWVTTSSHHNDHHKYAKDNYGLYLKIWDKKFKTLNPNTESHFDEKR
jgi:sterol desaturase/sphingolipid hydroxylase (fatty acid hydroxylase superfamily)